MHKVPIPLVVAAVLIGLAGCANPAADKPEAVVEEAASVPAASGGERFAIHPDSKVSFVGSKVTGSHDGGFHQFDGELRVVDGRPELSSVEVQIDTTSLWADNERLTQHLKSPDFFDVEQYPTASFVSTKIEPMGDHYMISGNLDLHGVTKQITFPSTIQFEDGRVKAQSEFSIKRFDFGIVYPGKAEDLIRDEVVVRLDLVATPAASEGAPAAADS